MKAVTRLLTRLMSTPLMLLAGLWGALALYYQLPGPGLVNYLAIGLWALLSVALLVLLWWRSPLRAWLGQVLLYLPLLLWWSGMQATNEHLWADDVAQMSTGYVEGDTLVVNNVRNFTWRTDQDYDVRWEQRRYDLTQLSSVDMLVSYWGMPAIAHVLISFGFTEGEPLLFSVEIRKKQGQEYSEIGGFFRQFELSIVATDERDAAQVRTNVRGEDVYLYRLNMPTQARRELLLSYIEQANQLAEHPQFYNTVLANCSVIVYRMANQVLGGLPLDYRLLLTGYLPSYVEEIGGLQAGYSLDELRAAGRITERAQQVDSSVPFSQRIRQGVPGVTAE